MMASFLKPGPARFAVYRHHGPYEERLRTFTVTVKTVGAAFLECEARTAANEVWHFQLGSTWVLHPVKHHADTWFLPDRLLDRVGFETASKFV
jgi:hypothetical protein